MSPYKTRSRKKPVVLCFSGHDPSGGAGIQADIEAIAAQGAHAVTVITALTCQDSARVHHFEPVDACQLQRQCDALLNDISINAIKIGMTASVDVVKAIHQIIRQQPDIPVILDPVLASGGGDSLSAHHLIDAINTYLVPGCHLITPNIPEVLRLTHAREHALIERAAHILLESGCENVLVTGTHSDSDLIEHRLYNTDQSLQHFTNARLPYEYHGSGCTLASSIAAFVAQGKSTASAVLQALDYTFQSLQNGHCPGKGQHFPDRLYTLTNDT
ncbi:MAG: hydroxymethylpyrimidine/phosphomethylpyrimidine kinase [Gammaproteobacteria bacterium]|nr:hydroxymethylpyrimidine/phosphomethylpyrimidine kinase [Gammaproteobacteria bacterium]